MTSLSHIKLVISDVDGVMTDGRLYYDHHGDYMRAFHVHDGLGIKMLRNSGVKFVIISASKEPGSITSASKEPGSILSRAKDLGMVLGINTVVCNSSDKGKDARRIIESLKIPVNQVACIGDDLTDIPMFAECGVSFAPANAMAAVRAAATIVLTKNGGEGAVRELADLILRPE